MGSWCMKKHLANLKKLMGLDEFIKINKTYDRLSS